jgi:hypothetical protein
MLAAANNEYDEMIHEEFIASRSLTREMMVKKVKDMKLTRPIESLNKKRKLSDRK